MTPEERAQQLDRWIVSHYGVSKGRYTAYSEILECIRAALRERDAAWVKAATGVSACWHVCMTHATPCRFCAPLRALLEEAGK